MGELGFLDFIRSSILEVEMITMWVSDKPLQPNLFVSGPHGLSWQLQPRRKKETPPQSKISSFLLLCLAGEEYFS